jgi:NADH-quinone oxidoreductase subunit K
VNTKANAADGKLMALFAIVLSAAAIALALAIVVKVYQYFNTINPDQVEEFKN